MIPPHAAGSDTSRAAAEAIVPRAPKQRLAVLDCITEHGSLTCDAVEVWLGMSHQTTSARVYDLVKAGAIVDSGERRPTRTGRKAAVYVVRARHSAVVSSLVAPKGITARCTKRSASACPTNRAASSTSSRAACCSPASACGASVALNERSARRCRILQSPPNSWPRAGATQGSNERPLYAPPPRTQLQAVR